MTDTSGQTTPADDLPLGPLQFVAVEFPTGAVTGSGFSELLAQVDAGTIFVVDLEFLRRGEDGTLARVPAGSLEMDGVDLSQFDGADSGLLDDADLELVATGVTGDGVLAVLVYEDLALSATLAGWTRQGGRVVAEGPVEPEDLEAALDAPRAASE